MRNPPTSGRRVFLFAGAALLALSSCGGGGGTGGSGRGGSTAPAPFRVVVATPADGTNGVSPDARVEVTFSLPVDRTSLTSATMSLVSVPAGVFPGAIGVLPGSADRALQFLHPAPLAEGTTYSVILSPTLRSTTGETLGGSHTIIFRTEGSGGSVIPPPEWALHPTIGPLDQGRRNHTATLIPDGSVLICGGFIQGTQISDRAERFDVPAEMFATLANRMRQPRAGHSATSLADGRVLLAGGYFEVAPGALGTTNSAEIFDPATGSFVLTGSMSHARADHAALRLPDGRVLVTGGSELLGGFLADHTTAEAFDPLTGKWADWPVPLTHTRSSHRMVDLLDGRWLLVGGSDVDLRPETFDPATGLFTPIAPAPKDRARFGLAVEAFESGNLAVVGGEQFGDVLYFSRAGTQLVNTGSPTTRPRAYATATRIAPDRILVAGGIDIPNGGSILGTCDLIVEGGLAGSGTYATSIHFPTGMADHTATVLRDGRVLFAGGLNAVAGLPELRGAYLFVP